MATAALERSNAPKSIPKAIKPAKIVKGVRPVLVARRSDLDGSDVDLDLTKLGGRLAYARLRADVTQEALGEAIDKVRGTIVAYESDKIMPPISVVEAMAKVLNVSPSFIAFGEHGVKSAPHVNAAESMINIDEITYGRDGSYVSGAFAMQRSLVESYVESARDLKVYVMTHHAEAFDIRAGDRIFTDISVTDITNEFDSYLIEVPGGMEMVRIAPSFTKSATVTVEGPRGDKVETKVRNLKIIGAVVTALKQN